MAQQTKVDSAAKLKEIIAAEAKNAAKEHIAEAREEAIAREKELRSSLDALRAEVAKNTAKALGDKRKGIELAQMCRAIAHGGKDHKAAVEYAEKNGFDELIVKALATSPGSAGGYIIPPGYSADLIELLYNKTAVRQLGAVSKPMPNGQMTEPKVTSGITAQYIGENAGQNAQQPVFGVIGLSWKKLRALVPISNDSIRYSSPRSDDAVRNDMVNAFRVGEDLAFLRSPGSGTSPKGIKYWIPAANSNAAQSADGSDLTLVIDDLFSLPRRLEEANIPMISPGFVISPRTKYFLMSVRDSVGQFYFLEEMRRGMLIGYPFVSTNQVPSNLGGGQDESDITFGDFADAIIGESDELLIDVSTEASYKDEGGNLVSAFDLDQTVLRGIARHDFVVRRQESFAELTTVQ